MIVADASTLTAMALIGRVELIVKLVGKVSASDYTVREVKETLAALDPSCAPPGEDVVQTAPIDVASPTLSTSEGETLALARQQGAKLVLSDDPVLRAEARKYKVNSLGTVGLLYAARARGLMGDVRQAVERLRQVGYALSPGCERKLLSRAAK